MKQLTLGSAFSYGVGAIALLALMPLVASAQLGEVGDFFTEITSFLTDIVIPLLFALAFVVFVWGVIQYFFVGDPDKKDNAKHLMLYGIIGFVLIVGIWGITALLVGGLGFEGEVEIPAIPN